MYVKLIKSGQITFGVFGAALAAITGVGMRRRAQMAPAMEALRFFDCNKAIFSFKILICRYFILFDILSITD